MAGTDPLASAPNARAMGRPWLSRGDTFLAQATKLLLGIAFLVTPARADTMEPDAAPSLEVSLDYVVPPGCPDMRTFERAVASRLGYFPFRGAAQRHVLVRIEASAPSLFGQVEWHDPSGEWVGDQSFPGGTAGCVELARTIAIALAVQIHLLEATENPASVAASSALPTAPEESPAEPRPAPKVSALEPKPADGVAAAAREKPPVAPWEIGVGGGLSLGNGLSSGIVGVGGLFALFVRRPVSLELGGELGLPSTTRRGDGAGYTQQLVFGSFAGCGAHSAWSACVVAKVGMARVRGRDIDVPASDSDAIFQTGLRVAIAPKLGSRGFFRARVEGLVTLTPWTVTLDGLGVWTAPIFAGSIGLDAGVFLP